MTIRAVLFDYGMVLSGPPDAVARRRMETLLGADADSFHQAYWQFRDGYDRGTPAKVYWHEVARALGRHLDETTLTALIEADTAHWTQPNEAMIAWAVRLQQAGVKTGILSNLGDAMEAGVHAKFPWLAGFSHKTFSHRVGVAKPDEAVYQIAIAGLEVEPREILFVDDREENIAAAHAAGMAAIRYSDHASFLEAMAAASYSYLL